MKVNMSRFSVCVRPLLAGFALALTVTAQAQAPSDIVPRTNIAYDLLATLAANGRLTGYTLADFARGDRLYTREEIARIVRRDLAKTDGDSRFAVSTRILREEFAPELNRADPERFSLNPRIPARAGDVDGWVKARVLSDPNAFSGIGRFSAEMPFGRDGYAIVTGGNQRDEWFPAGTLVHPGTYGHIENAYAHIEGRVLNLSIGQMSPEQWSPAYSGALLIGAAMPAFPQIAVDKSFLLPGSLGRHVGRIQFNEFVGQYFETNGNAIYPDAGGSRRYLIGRRFTLESRRWTFGVSEAMKSTRLPDPEWAAVLPLYLYQNDWTKDRKRFYLPFLATSREPDTYWKNYQGSIEADYHAGRSLDLFAGLLADDFHAPHALGGGYSAQQKLGEQYGISLPHPANSRTLTDLRLEYTTVDPSTYTNASNPVNWSQNGGPIGFPSGPNARVLLARADLKFSRKVSGALEAETRRDHGTPIPGYLPINTNRVSAYASYALANNAFLGLRVDHGDGLRDDLITVGPRRTRAELSAGFGL